MSTVRRVRLPIKIAVLLSCFSHWHFLDITWHGLYIVSVLPWRKLCRLPQEMQGCWLYVSISVLSAELFYHLSRRRTPDPFQSIAGLRLSPSYDR
ncbi:hypothetical protein IW261DRAFT_1468803 [Armillaria novae-zelandiae]|uniref:Uncharacterized protein n=1 Tax=Armillaria novae-zelandiae TaxID=153914 RepID=A0AA39PEB2_9AGAR|nr:hypothetical protein IW261DRAFT_1468803 [Armillaria novae-zelandiae]